jgi:hypothetical protein
MSTISDHLLTQAVIRDRETFFDDVFTGKIKAADGQPQTGGTAPGAGSPSPLAIGCVIMFAGLVALVGIVIAVIATR